MPSRIFNLVLNLIVGLIPIKVKFKVISLEEMGFEMNVQIIIM